LNIERVKWGKEEDMEKRGGRKRRRRWKNPTREDSRERNKRERFRLNAGVGAFRMRRPTGGEREKKEQGDEEKGGWSNSIT